LNFKRILGLEVAVKAVSEPDKKPDIMIKNNKHPRSNKVKSDI
jgi:hypothetical protein